VEGILDSGKFAAALKARGYTFVAGVPCTWLKGVIEALRADASIDYVGAPSEAAAVGIAAGAWLAGKTPAVLMQNNGLVNCMDVVSSLVQLYRIPLLMVVTWRGHGGEDFEEHLAVGGATAGLLKSFDVPLFAPGRDTVEKHLKVASFTSRMGNGPVALLLREGVLE
jgi:sulfopyruvate decarboxylase subunit alpha